MIEDVRGKEKSSLFNHIVRCTNHRSTSDQISDMTTSQVQRMTKRMAMKKK